MNYRKLGNTNLKVSQICLGSMNWGEQNTEEEAYAQLDYAVSEGINFIDTAEVYPIPPNENSQGRTEIYLGNWLKKSGKRNDLVIASKIIGRDNEKTYIRNGDIPRLDKKNVKIALEGSLKRLKTDHIDLYQLHWPDRITNYFGPRGYKHDPNDTPVPLEETLEALKEQIKKGTIRYIGLSNETAWGVMECFRLHREKNLPLIQSIQNPYSLIMREYEASLAEISIRERLSLLVYSPLAYSVLTGKYLGDVIPKRSRFGYSMRNSERYNPPHAQKAIEEYVKLAKKYDLHPAELGLAFVNSREFVTSTIIGATSVDQLKMNIGSINIQLDDDILNEIEEIYTKYPNPIS